MKKLFYFLIFSTTLNLNLFSQTSDFPDTLGLSPNSINIIKNLYKNGVSIESERLVCWFPKDSIEQSEVEAIGSLLNKGIVALEKIINAPLDWQKYNSDVKIHVFFANGSFISHAVSGFQPYVFIPFQRIKSQTAPWQHEILHVMLASTTGNYREKYGSNWDVVSKNKPLWLLEGLPTYLAAEVSKKESLAYYDPLTESNRSDFDQLFKELLISDPAKETLQYIGTTSYPQELFRKNRRDYAPAFYNGSASLCSFITDNHGLDVLIEAIGSVFNEHAVIEKRTGLTMTQLKEQWLQKLELE